MRCLESLFERFMTLALLGAGFVFLVVALFCIVVVSVEYRVNSKEIIESRCVNNTVVYRNTLSGSIATAGQACSE